MFMKVMRGFEFQRVVRMGGVEMGAVVGVKGVRRGDCLRLTIILRKLPTTTATTTMATKLGNG